MSEFINTADVIGDNEMCDQILTGTVTKCKDNRISKVGQYAFYGCTALTEVDVPNVTSIGDQSFNKCTALTKVNLPKITYVPTGAFSSSGIQTLDMPNLTGVGAWSFQDCKGLKTVNLPNVTSTNNEAFEGCSALEEAQIPKLGYVNYELFRDCPKLKNANFPVATEIAGSAFQNCSELTEVDTPKVTKIQTSAFLRCVKLTRVNAPMVTSIPQSCFEGCTEFDGTGLDFTKITDIALYGFRGSGLTKADFPLLATVAVDGFNGCPKLTEVDLSEATIVATNGFANCTALIKVDTPKVTKLDYQAFIGCSSLAFCDFPVLTSIASCAFQNCVSLKALVLRSESPCTLAAADAFKGNTPILNGTGYIYVPRALVDSYKSATNWSTYANQFRAIEDYTVDGTVTGRLTYRYRKLVDRSLNGSYVNNRVTSIGNQAFYSCSKLESVDFAAVTSIGTDAFYQCYPLRAVILRSETLCTLSNSGAFGQTAVVLSGTGYIYVPRALVDTYKSATNWSTVSSQIRALEDYTVDGTITGELDKSKI